MLPQAIPSLIYKNYGVGSASYKPFSKKQSEFLLAFVYFWKELALRTRARR
jgi:hypothetical protein